ncbi:MAG: hypothetical protein AAF480_16200 [Actinomycetota bacterium]
MQAMFDRLRLIVSLAHQVPDAELTVHRRASRSLQVGFQTGADIDLCQFRRMLMSSACPVQADIANRIEEVEVGGSLEVVDADLFRLEIEGHEHRLFATLVNPDLVFEILESLDCDPHVSHNVTATLRPDPGLGVTTVVIGVEDESLESRIDELARLAYDACLVEELLISAMDDDADHLMPGPHRTAPAETSDTEERS